jgi:membrane protease YdiL (CAAX protease family)
MHAPDYQFETLESHKNLHVLQGEILFGLLVITATIPALRQWPLYLFVPVSAYGLLVYWLPPLRQTTGWLGFGQFSLFVGLATALLLAATVTALLVFQELFKPNLDHLLKNLPLWLPGHILVVTAVASALNALLEEVVFRGVFLDALGSLFGIARGIAFQGLVFGLAHFEGYPPGPVGVALAAIFGVAMGALRYFSGSLFAPWIVHSAADATIFYIGLSYAGID